MGEGGCVAGAGAGEVELGAFAAPFAPAFLRSLLVLRSLIARRLPVRLSVPVSDFPLLVGRGLALLFGGAAGVVGNCWGLSA